MSWLKRSWRYILAALVVAGAFLAGLLIRRQVDAAKLRRVFRDVSASTAVRVREERQIAAERDAKLREIRDRAERRRAEARKARETEAANIDAEDLARRFNEELRP